MSDLLENTQFQIVSSSSLLSFHQARFSLLDSVSANLGYTFKDSGKALLLALFDNILLWNNEAYMALKSTKSGDTVSDYVVESLTSSFRSTLMSSVKVIQTKYNIVDGQASILFMVVTSRYYDVIERRIKALLKTNRILAYSDLNNFLVHYMYHLFRFVHELDYLINAPKRADEFEPFINIDEFDLKTYLDHKVTLPILRLTAYKETKLFTDMDLCIKLYVDRNMLDSDRKMNSALESIMDSIESQGTNIICIL